MTMGNAMIVSSSMRSDKMSSLKLVPLLRKSNDVVTGLINTPRRLLITESKSARAKLPPHYALEEKQTHHLIGEDSGRSQHGRTTTHHSNTYCHFLRADRNREYGKTRKRGDKKDDCKTHEEVLRVTNEEKTKRASNAARFSQNSYPV